MEATLMPGGIINDLIHIGRLAGMGSGKECVTVGMVKAEKWARRKKCVRSRGMDADRGRQTGTLVII